MIPAYLVFVYFLNDAKINGPVTIDTWKGAIELLHKYLGISAVTLPETSASSTLKRTLPVVALSWMGPAMTTP